MNVDNIIGKLLEDAKIILADNHICFRISRKDGFSGILTCDYRTDRINLIVENNIVMSYKIG